MEKGAVYWFNNKLEHEVVNNSAIDRIHMIVIFARGGIMLTAQVEDFVPFLEEVKPLLQGHWDELALNKDKVPLDPQYGQYLKYASEGVMLVVTLREAGTLVGYFIGMVAPGLHYKACLTYTMDIFYVKPECRGQNGGAMMAIFLEKELQRRGVHRMFVGTKCHKDASFLFEKLGYNKVEVYYSKWLGE
jgi:GNAT superfamily N-acetyltransferase